MSLSVANSKSRSMAKIHLWIDNQQHTSDIVFPIVNNESGITVHEAYGANPELAVQAAESANRAFFSWRKTTPWYRRQMLLKAADYLRHKRDQVADLIRLETPAPDVTIEKVNIDSSIELLEELAGAITIASAGVVPHTRDANTMAMIIKEPYGVHLGIAPWNASLFLAMRAVLTPIACGNTAILKASEFSPAIHQWIGKMLADVGFPPGVLNIVQHRRQDAPQVLEALIAHRAVKKVNFTGSTAVGSIVAGVAARYCKPTLMELGGKAPQVVLEDADLDAAAQAAVTGALLHMVSITASWPMTSAVSEAGVAKTETLIRDALAHGSSLANPPPNNDQDSVLREAPSRLRPVILTKVTPKMRIYHEESFGPAVSILEFDSDDEALRLANESIYGLSASIFTENVPRALRIARQIDAGAVHINSMSIHDEQQLPHGGTKSSGWGRFGVPWSFDEFLQLKTITVTSKYLEA
ncbi:hypothetical protein LTS17_001431 [Exophiala oligosperma]